MAGPPRGGGAPAGSEPVFRAELVEMAPSRGLALFGIAGALVSVLALVLLGLRGGAAVVLVLSAVGLALLPFAAEALRGPVRREVEAEPEGLRLDGKLRARRADVESAMLVPASAGNKPMLRVRASGLAGRALLSLSPLVYRLASPEVVVGADGFELRGALENRFVPYASVEAVEVAGVDLVGVRLRSGERMLLRTGYGDGNATAREVRRRMARDLEAHRRGEAVDLPALLARGAEPLAPWLPRLRSVGAEVAGGPRRAALPAESLWAVVENAAAPSGLRVGAASVLADLTRGEPEGASRLGGIADAAAPPELRRALRVATGGRAAPEAELEQAILAVERLEGGRRA